MTPAPHGAHVLCVRLDGLGDVLLSGAAVRAVAAVSARVTMLVAPGQEATARLLPGVTEVLSFEAAWVRFDPPPLDVSAVRQLVALIGSLQVDAALVFTSFHQSPLPMALLLRMAGVGWVGAVSEDYPGSLLDLRHRVPPGLPEAERTLSLAVTAGFAADAGGSRLVVRSPLPPRPSWVPTSPYVVLHPGATAPARRPSATVSRAFAAALAADGWPVVVTGGPGERALTAEVAGSTAVDAAGRLELAELGAVLAGAAAAVVPNTGPAHLAAAVGTPVVSLFAPVVPWASWRPHAVPTVRLGDQEAACRLSRARLCPVPGHPCLDVVRPQEVVAAVRRLTEIPASPVAATPPTEAAPR